MSRASINYVAIAIPVEAFDAVFCDKTWVQLKYVVDEKVTVDFRIKVGFLTHKFREPFGTSLPVLWENSPLGQAVPYLFGLLRAQPKLPVSQKEPNEVEALLDL